MCVPWYYLPCVKSTDNNETDDNDNDNQDWWPLWNNKNNSNNDVNIKMNGPSMFNLTAST